MTKNINTLYNTLIFIDLEVDKSSKKIYEIGIVFKNIEYKTSSIKELKSLLFLSNSKYICGHNFIDFDFEMLFDTSIDITKYKIIDTLPLSLLLFSEKSIHALPKDYKQEDDFKNDPILDCKLTSNLLHKIEDRFMQLSDEMKSILFSLLKYEKYFNAFFDYMKQRYSIKELNQKELFETILNHFKNSIVNLDYLKEIIETHPTELVYILSLLNAEIEMNAHPPYILYKYKNIVEIQKRLCFDSKKIDLIYYAKEFFGFDRFRDFTALNPTILQPNISQKDIIEATLQDESFIAVLPTGGGKTFIFWLPAIIKAKSYKGLSVVISPLQALMKDHITNFNKKVSNYKAVAISGFLSPLERSEAIESVISGDADILYIAPESLRSKAIFNILKNRVIDRFIVDEAHCLSTWGNDFRQDYFYICDYIKDLMDAKKGFQDNIPISCFTATAKPSVLDDIKEYFKQGLDLDLKEFIAKPDRKNLKYNSIKSEQKQKYKKLLDLINTNSGSTLIYIPSSTTKCDEIAHKLTLDTSKVVKSFHSKIDSTQKMKILKQYINNEIDIIVATTAFGMGVDKPDIKNVIHYEISDSLENYAQEAGRGARDESLEANCQILFDEDDLDKHFATLNRSKITASEINSIFRVIKNQKGDSVYLTTFELAKMAGWDIEDSANDYSTKVKSALLELEREEYISRKRNIVNFFADSVVALNMEQLHKKLENCNYTKEQKELIILLYQHIIRRGMTKMVAIDELSHILGASKDSVSLAIYHLKELGLLSDNKDLSANITKRDLNKYSKIINIVNSIFEYILNSNKSKYSIKELNEYIIQNNISTKNESNLIVDILREFRDKTLFVFKRINRQKDIWYIEILDREELKSRIYKRDNTAKKIIQYFETEIAKNGDIVEFSLKELKKLFKENISPKEIDKTLLYLHHLKVIELLQGRFISYMPMTIIKTDKIKEKYKRYTLAQYRQRLAKYYQNRAEGIHIVGKYADILENSEKEAKSFLLDYFTMNYAKFKRKYKLLKSEITRSVTKKRYDNIFSTLSNEQKIIIEDKSAKAMMILAGPGSGKTKVLVHKIASLLLTEDIKPEQFLMLTFSKTAASEFRYRLNSLIGTLSYDIEIHTFHAYALKLIAREVKEHKDILDNSIQEATKQIVNGDITLPLFSVLVLDEYQDINDTSFKFIEAIYKYSNDDMRVIAVGDDDQCIMDFNGANVEFINRFKDIFGQDSSYKQYNLLTNFRSATNIVNYTNDFIVNVKNRFKNQPLKAHKSEDGNVIVKVCKSENLNQCAVETVEDKNFLKNSVILTYHNEDVMKIYSYLNSKNIGAKYILDREGFHLKNMIEIYEFNKELQTKQSFFTEEHFNIAFEKVAVKFNKSKNLKLLRDIIDRFLCESLEYYPSEWISYLDEIKLEDFIHFKNTVTISTIHKSKGMEFDNVILIVNYKEYKDNIMRLYYVGMTRAKNNLIVIKRSNHLPKTQSIFAKYILDEKEYSNSLQQVTLIMGLKDVNLGFENSVNIVAGDMVDIKMFSNKFRFYYKGNVVDEASKIFTRELLKYINRGYKIDKAIVEFVILWKDLKHNSLNRHILCKIKLVK